MNSSGFIGDNPYIGTWRMVSAQIEHNGNSQPAFGERPIGLLSFTSDMHFVEVLMDADTLALLLARLVRVRMRKTKP